jgi:hypothetical protein
MGNFPDAARMDAMGAAQVVRNAPQLAQAWLSSGDPALCARTQEACRAWFDTVGGASARSWKIMKECMERAATSQKPGKNSPGYGTGVKT